MERRQTTGAGIALALLLVVGLVVVLTDDDGAGDGAGACTALAVSGWTADAATTDEFARYGDDATRTDDWTGGDGNHSVRLPDGRTLWLVSDPYLGRVQPPPNRQGQPHAWRDTTLGTPAWTRNAALVMSADGRLERTLLGGAPGAPTSLFPEPAAPLRQWRWPVHAVVEPRAPGSSEQVLRVLLWHRQEAQQPWIYGVPLATEVATLSLPDLRLEGITQVDDQSRVADPADRVVYGAAAVRRGGFTYVWGGTDGRTPDQAERSSRAHLARVPAGRLADRSAWRYWDGERWSREAARSAPVLGDGGRRGVGSAFSVVRRGDTWVLFTMDAGGPRGSGLTTVASYWACRPEGPWHGPDKAFTAPLPDDAGGGSGAAAYNPQAHPGVGSGDGLLLGYDVNWLDASADTVSAHVHRNVALYRPRFVRLHLDAAG